MKREDRNSSPKDNAEKKKKGTGRAAALKPAGTAASSNKDGGLTVAA